MDQNDYESQLEFRICVEFAGMAEGRFREFWCDGIMLGAFLLDSPNPRILGQAWICEGTVQDEWRVELRLPSHVCTREMINWEGLLAPDNMTRWIAVDLQKKHIQIEPAAAVPDVE